MLLLENVVGISFHHTGYSKSNVGKILFTDIEVYHLVRLALIILRNCTFSHFILIYYLNLIELFVLMENTVRRNSSTA